MRRTEGMERFAGIEFREHENLIAFPRVPALDGRRPVRHDRRAAELLSRRWGCPSRRLARRVALADVPAGKWPAARRDLYLQQPADAPESGRGTIFDNHIVRSRANYQFTRELSLRAILDYNAVLSDPSLVSSGSRTKHLAADMLLTYSFIPGTALYVGYTDGYDNVTSRHRPGADDHSDNLHGTSILREDKLLLQVLTSSATIFPASSSQLPAPTWNAYQIYYPLTAMRPRRLQI